MLNPGLASKEAPLRSRSGTEFGWREWAQVAKARLAELEGRAADNPKQFFGNHIVGVGEGLLEIREVLASLESIVARASVLNHAD